MSLEILDPTVRPDLAAERRRNPRPQALSGLRVGLLDNGKPGSAVVLRHLGAALQTRYGVASTLLRTKPSASTSAPPALIAELRISCDAVVVGVGD